MTSRRLPSRTAPARPPAVSPSPSLPGTAGRPSGSPAPLSALLATVLAAFVLAAVLAALAPSPAAAQGLALDLVEWAAGLERPVAMAAPADGSGRLFLVEQRGVVRIRDGSGLLATPFLDLSARVSCCGEGGLLGLAFHPGFADNGELFVDYTRTVDGQLQTVVSRFTVLPSDPDRADPASEEVLLVLDQPGSNHNGGQLAFGPDGYLYVATGDGGGGGDPFETGQALDTLLGKVLRIDVDGAAPGLAYAVPADNPFAGAAGARDEIWAYGLRNPWRFSFDRATGDLWIADVGQQDWEEVNLQPASSPGGENYGWDCREGAHPYDDPNGDLNAGCPAGGFTDPVLEYFQENGRCSVTGGYRYRGDAEPRLRGVYLYADFCTGEIFGTVPRCDGAWEGRVLLDAPFPVTAFGEDGAGEVYVTEFEGSGSGSRVHLLGLAPGSGGPDLAATPDPVDFGTVEVGDVRSAVLTLANANAGPEAVTVAAAVPSDGVRFRLDPHGGPSPCRTATPCLPPGASCTVAVELHPDAAATLSGSLALDGNFTGEVVSLAAEVVPCSTGAEVTLSSTTVTGTESHRACDRLTAGPDVTVASTGDLTLCAGNAVVLEDGFRVEGGGRLTLAVDCPPP